MAARIGASGFNLPVAAKVFTPTVYRSAEDYAADMQKIADQEGAGITIEPWDYRYYAEKVRKAKYDLDENEVKPYLQLDKLREAMRVETLRFFAHVMRDNRSVLELVDADYDLKHIYRLILNSETYQRSSIPRSRPAPEHFAHYIVRRLDAEVLLGESLGCERIELYNIADDRFETRNLAEQHPEQVSRLLAMWDQWKGSLPE